MDFDGMTADDMREFVAKGGDLDAREDGLTALHRAVMAEHPDLVRHLLDAGADPNVRSGEDANPPLVEVMECPEPVRGRMARALLDAGADPNLRNDRGVAALHIAFGDTGLIRTLVEVGADPDLPNERYGRPLHWAVSNAFEMEAVRGVCALIGAGADPNGRDAGGWRPIHRLFANPGHAEVLRALLSGGADPNAPDAEGRSPLHWVAARRYVETERMRILVDAGADPDSRSETGCTPLHEAVRRGDAAALQFLLEAGADPAARDNEGATVHDFLSRREATSIDGVGERDEREKIRALLESLPKEPPEPAP